MRNIGWKKWYYSICSNLGKESEDVQPERPAASIFYPHLSSTSKGFLSILSVVKLSRKVGWGTGGGLGRVHVC
jgi:hypothetical protein